MGVTIVTDPSCDLANTRVAITHTHAPQAGQFIAGELPKKLTAPVKELNVYAAGPTIGANVGPVPAESSCWKSDERVVILKDALLRDAKTVRF
jgi:hypothetical protein